MYDKIHYNLKKIIIIIKKKGPGSLILVSYRILEGESELIISYNLNMEEVCWGVGCSELPVKTFNAI